jgi:lipid-A-disaccharide synthase
VSGPLRVFVSAGDASGDLHAAELVRALRDRRPDATFEGFGGRALAEAGVALHERLADHPVMGLKQVLPSLGRFIGLLNGCDRLFASRPPDVVVPVDYPGFNVRLARLARRKKIPVCYYVCPQYWAWAPWRTRTLAAAVDLGLVTLPFESRFFDRYGMTTRFVGHPLADRLAGAPVAADAPEEFLLGLVPGSRRREIEANLPWQLAAARELSKRLARPLRLAAVHPDPERQARITAIARDVGIAVEVSGDPLPKLLGRCRFAFVTSGTATLEAALLGVPSVVVYRISTFERAARPFGLLVPFVSLPNLLTGHELFPEFVTDRDPSAAMAQAAQRLIEPGEVRVNCLRELELLRTRLLVPGTAARAADAILERLAR